MNRLLNLNADLGESFGPWSMGSDAEMLGIVGSANVACGYHAGDPLVMTSTAALALKHGVSIGAHPGYPDLQGFGRRRMDIPLPELEAMLIYQIGALDACARTQGLRVTHVKPHGALSNLACADRKIADAIARAVHRLDPGMILLAPAASQLIYAGREQGLPVVEEIFADRAYLDDGQLMPRSLPGAVLHDAQQCVDHVLAMLREQAIVAASGHRLPTRIDSICVHGDGPEAVASARLIRQALEQAGYRLAALDRMG